MNARRNKAGLSIVGLALVAATLCAGAQTAATPAPTPGAAHPADGAAQTATPQKSAPLTLQTLNPTTEADPFPAVNPANFTAPTPAPATVDSYLHAVMGYDASRMWRVLAVQKTIAPGVSRVVVAISERKPGAKVLSAVFYVTPDGKHLIATDSSGGAVSSFGAHPYAESRELLQAQADGPARGSASKDLMLVEFGDLQCSHCKEAQPTMDRLAADFPKARIVFENFPLVQVHPYAMEAAEYGVCIAKKSSEAFFNFEKAVYATQAALVPATAAKTLDDASTKAGADAAAVAACAKSPATKSEVEAQIKLGADIGVNQTPTLVINGRLVPLTIPYETLRQLIAFQASLDGVEAAAASPHPTGISAGPQ